MRTRFEVFVREHHTGWFTASLLAMPAYASHGPSPSTLLEEIAEVVGDDLDAGALRLSHTASEDWTQRTLSLEVRAVQHERLTTVPMRFSVFFRKADAEKKTFEVRIPRLEEVYRIHGEENVMPWAEEIIRGRFHLKDVGFLLAHQLERAERLEMIDVVHGGARAARKRKGTGGQDEPAPFALPSPLSEHGLELVEEARRGRLPRAELRDALVEELHAVVASRRSPCALLVGPSGAGKTALVHELAHRIANAKEGSPLEGAKLWFIPGSRFVAGARFLGEWQERVRRIVEALRGARDLLYLGDIAEVLGMEFRRTGLDPARYLLAEMRTGGLSVIAEATPDALTYSERINTPFVAAFQRIPVPPLGAEDASRVLDKATRRLEKAHRVKFGEGAVSGVLDVVGRFGDAEGLPGSGLALLEQMAKGPKEPELGGGAAIRAFARASGFPEALIDPEQRIDPAAVRAFFDARVIGQPEASAAVSNVILLMKTGLNDPSKPLGSFLFMGPTGVGKTETASALAEYLFGDRKRLVRIDMSEYAAPGSALRLIDGPDGQGALTRPIRERPFSLVLLDEIEKADSGTFDVLLQLLGEGRLTDGTGRTVRFTHTIVVMTSNLGAVRRAAVGFSARSDAKQLAKHYADAAERFFRPEIMNRIDQVVPFTDLSQDSLRAIARKLLDEAVRREGLSRRGIAVRLGEGIVERLLEVGFDPRYGARPMKRAVEAMVAVPLSRSLSTWPEDRRGAIELAVEGLEVVARETT